MTHVPAIFQAYSPLRPGSPAAKPCHLNEDGGGASGLDAEASLREIHFFHMNSQGNIFTLANLPKSESRARKLISACLSKPIYAMDLMPEKVKEFNFQI